ncbi:hypothetical protein [Carp edema virus]|nr:hypothetical protein [Carp edema virus]
MKVTPPPCYNGDNHPTGLVSVEFTRVSPEHIIFIVERISNDFKECTSTRTTKLVNITQEEDKLKVVTDVRTDTREMITSLQTVPGDSTFKFTTPACGTFKSEMMVVGQTGDFVFFKRSTSEDLVDNYTCNCFCD